MDKLKIGIVSDWFFPDTGGGETHVYELASWLTKHGHEVHLYTNRKYHNRLARQSYYSFPFKLHTFSEKYSAWARKHIPDRRYPSLYWASHIELMKENILTLQRLKLDLIHCHSSTLGLAGIIAAEILQLPTVFTQHLDSYSLPMYRCSFQCEEWTPQKCMQCALPTSRWLKRDQDKIWGMGAKQILGSSITRIICPTRAVKRSIESSGVISGNLEVISNWVDCRRFGRIRKTIPLMRKYGIEEGQKIVLCVGRISKGKGIEHLIRAFGAVNRRMPETRLMLTGRIEHRTIDPGYADSLNRVIDNLGLRKTILFAGNLGYHDVPEIYALADVKVLPSLGETQSLVTMEAMASGLPVVVTDLPSIRSYVKQGKNGLLVGAGDTKGLARGIIRVLQDRELARRLGRNARRTMREEYDIGLRIKKMTELYRRVIAEKKKVFEGK